MKNLTLQICLTLVLLIWIGTSFRCSMMQEGLLVYPSRFLLDTEQINTINRLVQEDIQRVQTQAILKERQQILSAKTQQIDGLSLQPYKKQGSVGLGLPPHLSMSTQATYGNLRLLYGLTKTDTVGSTLND